MIDYTENIAIGLARGTRPSVGARPTRVLLAEDDVVFRRLVASQLRHAGFEVLEVSDGAEALDLIGDSLSSSKLGAPDVVVSDIRMPCLTGLQIAASLRGIEPRIPTILFTAFGDAGTHALAARLGAVMTLDKPFDIEVLRQAIGRLPGLSSRNPHVLVVDESVPQASALAEILRDEGATAVFATSAADALDACMRHAPDVVVIDATLRGEDSGRLLARLRERTPNVPAVVLTGFPADSPHVAALIDADAVYLAKPVDLTRLLALIRWLVDERPAAKSPLRCDAADVRVGA